MRLSKYTPNYPFCSVQSPPKPKFLTRDLRKLPHPLPPQGTELQELKSPTPPLLYTHSPDNIYSWSNGAPSLTEAEGVCALKVLVQSFFLSYTALNILQQPSASVRTGAPYESKSPPLLFPALSSPSRPVLPRCLLPSSALLALLCVYVSFPAPHFSPCSHF